jgi:MtrB/PioB family decaheme-associated outer membrane protein
MRLHTLAAVIALGLAPTMAVAQPQSPGSGGTPASVPSQADARDEFALPTTSGRVDFGVRFTSTTGDAARYERYRDLDDGIFAETGRLYSEKNGWVYGAAMDHLGRRDQRLAGRAVRPGQVEVWTQWDQIPMLMSRTTQTLFAETSPGVLDIDDTVQANAQADPATLSGALETARVFNLESRRHIFETGGQVVTQKGVTIDATFRHTDRQGLIPYGGSFGHSQVVETIAPVNHTIGDLDTSAEYSEGNLLLRAGYTGSWFTNEAPALIFDNAFRLPDSVGAGGRGRTALAPNNSYIGVNGMGSYKMPYRSRVLVYGSIANLRDTGQALLPFTINTALVSPTLDRTTTDGHARITAFNATFTSRPTNVFDVDVRVKSYDYANRTSEFLAMQRVAYDNTVSNVTNPALQYTEPFGVSRMTADADFRYRPHKYLSTTLGFGHQSEARTHRIFEDISENIVRLTVDSIRNPWVTLRTKYEHGSRRGEGDATEIGKELAAIGEQPGMRHFDVASRDRNRFTMTAMATPSGVVSVNGSFAAGKDDFIESEFGLRDNTHTVLSGGFDYAPSDYFGAGLSYSFERYNSLSRSRQADNAADAADPSRNWATDTTDKAHSLIGHLEMREIRQVLTLSTFLDLNFARGVYHYITGPVPDRTLPEEVEVPSSLPPPTQLPDVESNLARLNVDALYALQDRWDLGVSVWFEKYTVDDFSLEAEATQKLDPRGGLLIGYTYQPYTAATVWLRAVYKF